MGGARQGWYPRSLLWAGCHQLENFAQTVIPAVVSPPPPSGKDKAYMLCTARRESGDHSHWHVLLSLALAWAQSLEETNPKHLVVSSGLPNDPGEGWATEKKTHSNKPRPFCKPLLRHRTSHRKWRCHRGGAGGVTFHSFLALISGR